MVSVNQSNTTEILHVGTFAGHIGHGLLRPLWWKGYRQGAPTTWKPKGTKRAFWLKFMFGFRLEQLGSRRSLIGAVGLSSLLSSLDGFSAPFGRTVAICFGELWLGEASDECGDSCLSGDSAFAEVSPLFDPLINHFILSDSNEQESTRTGVRCLFVKM